MAADVMIFTNQKIDIEEKFIEDVYKYGKTFITETTTHDYFRKLYNYINGDLAINFKNLHK